MFCNIPSENDHDIFNKICCFAVSENNNVCIVVEISVQDENVQRQYKLKTFDDNGNAIADRALDVIDVRSWLHRMTVSKDGKPVIYCGVIKLCTSVTVQKPRKTTDFLCL